jgi:hypothetical protein
MGEFGEREERLGLEGGRLKSEIWAAAPPRRALLVGECLYWTPLGVGEHCSVQWLTETRGSEERKGGSWEQEICGRMQTSRWMMMEGDLRMLLLMLLLMLLVDGRRLST